MGKKLYVAYVTLDKQVYYVCVEIILKQYYRLTSNREHASMFTEDEFDKVRKRYPKAKFEEV